MSSYSALNALLGSSSSSTIDITSILQAAMGASSPGIDVSAAVNSAVTAARAPETAWQNQANLLQNQTNALKKIQSHVSTLDDDMQKLGSVVGSLTARTATSSNPGLVTATAASSTIPSNHVLTVNGLATTGAWTSAPLTDASSAMPAGSFTISMKNGASHQFTTDGLQTLQDVVDQINGQSLGVTARVVTDATGSRLAIVANASGSAADFTVQTDVPDYGFKISSSGNDSSVTVDGITYTNSINTVTNAIAGVTLNLTGSAQGVQLSLAITPDTDGAVSAINQFVSDFNTVISDLSSQFTFNGSSEGVLGSDSTVRSLQNALLGFLGYTYTPASGSTTVSALSSLGISVENDGTLTVDSSTMKNAIQGNIDDVQTFFQGTAANGFANTLDQELTSFISPSDGAFTVDLQSMSGQISDLQANISDYEMNYITPLKTRLQSEYSQAEIALQQLPMLMQQINTELGYNNSKG